MKIKVLREKAASDVVTSPGQAGFEIGSRGLLGLPLRAQVSSSSRCSAKTGSRHQQDIFWKPYLVCHSFTSILNWGVVRHGMTWPLDLPLVREGAKNQSRQLEVGKTNLIDLVFSCLYLFLQFYGYPGARL